MLRKKTECCVGLDCTGPEWEDLHKYVSRFGESRGIGWDFKNYDAKTPSTMLLNAMDILIWMNKEFGQFDDDDFVIMEGIKSDLAYAIFNFDGTWVQFFGSLVSGNSLTVILNGINGSIWGRCAFIDAARKVKFKHLHKLLCHELTFRDFVALVVYGDDNVGSCSVECPWFGFSVFQQYLKSRGYTITAPDKSDGNGVQYWHLSDLDFLKRKFRYDREAGMHLAPLSMGSILKSLHMNLASEESPQGLAVATMGGAMREFFLHGRQVYDEWQGYLLETASRHKLPTHEIVVSFDQRLADWKLKHGLVDTRPIEA
jgi:hypothetical protein